MAQEQTAQSNVESLLTLWMDSARRFWEEMARIQTGEAAKEESRKAEGFGETADNKEKKGPAYQAREQLESSTRIFRSLVSAFSQPENMEALLGGLSSMPEFMTELSQQVWSGYMEIQSRWTEGMAKIGQHTGAYTFEDLDQEVFEKIREVYQNEFQKFFKAPQLGLTRFYQQRFNQFIDKTNLFQANLSELLYLFYVPIEKSIGVMQKNIEEMVEKGELRENFKDYYNMWVKTLEGHYMKLLQSPEYTRVLGNTIEALTEYRQAREDFLCDLLKELPVPTNKEMDALYREFYELKKEVRSLSKQLKNASQ